MTTCSRSNFSRTARFVIVGVAAAVATLTLAAPRARAQASKFPPEAVQSLDKVYAGDAAAGIAIARKLQHDQPQNALGYVLEGEARWSMIFCTSCEIKWGIVDAWKRPKSAAKDPEGANEDDAYFAAADKSIELANAAIAHSDNAQDRLYAAMGYALKARILGLRAESRATAHNAVLARENFIQSLALDPQMADATAGLGLYNYYVDSLSSIVKVLRFFMGIPGGSKEEGLKQMETGAKDGVLLKVTSRFYLARNLRTYDQQYARAAEYLAPLLVEYPQNPAFALTMANLEIEQGQMAQASTRLHAMSSLTIPNPDCAERTRKVITELLATTH